MKRTSKYVGKQFGNWVCTEIGISNVQGRRAKRPGHCNYWYTFQRDTSDKKCEKLIRLNSTEAAKVYKEKCTVEEIMEQREQTAVEKVGRKIKYRFI